MKHPLKALLACTAIVLCLGACNARVDTDQDRQQIQQLLDTYFQSVKTADVAVASKIWLQSADIVLPTTDGREIRLRRITEPTAEQKLLLRQLGISLPEHLQLQRECSVDSAIA